MTNRFAEKLAGFANVSPADIDLLTDVTAWPVSVPARHDLIREGDRPGSVFVMLEGWACRYKMLPEGGRQIMAFLMPGDACDIHVSELAEMDHCIATITPSSVAKIPREQVGQLLERPEIARALRAAQLVDEATLRAWIVSMGRRDSAARVAHLMCELYLRARNVGLATDDLVEMPLTQIILADALGLTPVHVNRMIKALREAGALTVNGPQFVITDPTKLAAIAGFDENYLHRRLRKAA